MPLDSTKTCFTCFWAWEENRILRCTRLPPSPLLRGISSGDINIANKTDYVRCPLIPGCGEWKAIEVPDIDIDDIDEEMRM